MSKYNIIFVNSKFKNFLTNKEKNYYDNNQKYKERRDKISNNLNPKKYGYVDVSNFVGTIHYIPTNNDENIYKSADIIIYVPDSNFTNNNIYESISNLLNSYFKECVKRNFLKTSYLNSNIFLLRCFGKEQIEFFKNKGIDLNNIIDIKN